MPSENAQDQSGTEKRKKWDAIRQEFREAQGSSGLQQPEVPHRLYHYTTINGLVGITSKHSLWASDVRFMNDASELFYATELISDVIAEAFSNVTSEVLKSVLPNRRGVGNWFEYGTSPFVTCFCEEGDLLSQWRGYRAGETGYSLGFDFSYLSHDLPPSIFLAKVVYDEGEQRRTAREVVETWLVTAASLLSKQGNRPEGLFPYPAIFGLQDALTAHHLCFKHPAFAEEREWRLIKLVNPRGESRLLDYQRMEKRFGIQMPEHVTTVAQAEAEGTPPNFRPSPIGLVPYVELRLKDRAGVFVGRLPLWEVVQGPTPTSELSRGSLETYLESCGYGPHAHVTASRIPLRD
jgi:hypothetical protein